MPAPNGPLPGTRAAAAPHRLPELLLLFIVCQPSGSGRGKDAGCRPGPGPDSAPPTRAGGGEPSAERGCVDARSPAPAGWSLRPRFARVVRSRSRSESFGAETSPRCAGRRAPEAAGRVAPGRVGLPAVSRSGGPGRTRLPPPPPPPPPPRDSGRSARRTGATFPLRLDSERGALAPQRLSFPCPPVHPSLVYPPPGKILLLRDFKSGPL